MVSLTGYSDQISVAPGDSIKFMVNCDGHKSYRARIVRVICGDLNPEGPGLKEEVLRTSASGTYSGRKQEIHAGSYGLIGSSPLLDGLDSFTVQAMIWPTTPDKRAQGLVTRWSGRSKRGFALVIDDKGCAAIVLGNGKTVTTLSSGKPLLGRDWYFVAASYDAKTKTVRLYQEPLINYETVDDGGVTSLKVRAAPANAKGAPLVFGAQYTGVRGGKALFDSHYNGKIDSPRVSNRALDRAEMEALMARKVPGPLAQDVVGSWDFSHDIQSEKLSDVSENRLHGETVNMPARAMTGYKWDGSEQHWRHRRAQWGAIHFHDDDVYDAGWDVDFELTIPEKTKSGLYAAKLTAGNDTEYMPFVIRPTPGKEKKIAFLFPSASYMAYANEHLATNAWIMEVLTNRLSEMQPYHEFLNVHREYGGSLYDSHSDGSGVCYSSRLRPVLNMRPTIKSALGGMGSSLWQFNADTHITDWLESTGYDYDVISDEDVHEKGLDILRPYSVVLTGSHPEYHSKQMYDAIHQYTQQGGRLMYLGANGFYWRIAYHQTKPGVIEVRRAEDGIRTWEARAGEYCMSFTGEFGGLWRRQGGRAPQVLAGTGFTAQGFDLSSYYVRRPDSFDARARFIFKGIGKNEKIGDFGLIGGGAAGLEIDRVDRLQGSPPHTLLLAQSEGHTDTYRVVSEEILATYPGTGGTENEMVRADMTFFETPNGGGVFSTSSIAWAGSLSHNNYDNNVAKITGNVLKRFIDPKPLA